MNVFVERIEAGKIKTLAQLKGCYRALAKSIHPDTATIDESGRLFMKLQEEYEEAKIIILEKRPVGEAEEEEDYKSLFQQLIASGFPIDSRARIPKAYRERVLRFGKAIDRKLIEGMGKFSDVELELAKLRGEGVVLNPLFGSVRLLFYHLVSHYYTPSIFTLGAIRKIYGEIEVELRAKGFTALDAFLGWMIGNFWRGAAPPEPR